MTRRLPLPALALIVALLSACAGPGSAPTGTAAAGSAVKTLPAADSGQRLTFSSVTLDGAPFDGRTLAGKPVVLWFWAAWCSVCAGESATVAKVAAANPGVRFVGVSALADEPAMRKFVADHGLGGLTHLADKNAAVWSRFGVRAQPAQAFIRADGGTEVVLGPMDERGLTEKTAALTHP